MTSCCGCGTAAGTSRRRPVRRPHWHTSTAGVWATFSFPQISTVVDETIYVLDIVERGLKSEHSRLQVFSFDGGFRRTVSGPDLCNLRPSFLEYYNGRLFAIERGCVRCAGQCARSCHNGNVGVCVLTPDGTTLQIYDRPSVGALYECLHI